MKYQNTAFGGVKELVTPCMGVWIEISITSPSDTSPFVTPCMGVWIEIHYLLLFYVPVYVTPCMGVWIEIPFFKNPSGFRQSHSLYGSVD